METAGAVLLWALAFWVLLPVSAFVTVVIIIGILAYLESRDSPKDKHHG